MMQLQRQKTIAALFERQTEDRFSSLKCHETNPAIARETQSDVAEESMDSKAGSSALSQNEGEAKAMSTTIVDKSSPSQNRAQVKDTQTGLGVALSPIGISACGVIAVLAGFIGNQITSLTHKLFFEAFMISLCVSFASKSCILVLKMFRPNIQCLTIVVDIFIIAVIGSLPLAVGFGVTYYFRKA